MTAGAHAILLAAGAGTRFGGRKLLAEWRGEPLVVAAARIALAAPVAEVMAVLGADAAEVGAALARIGDERLRPVLNPDWRTGLASSLKAGIDALPPKSERVVVLLGDMPDVPRDLAAILLHLVEQGAPAALVDVTGRPGHPVAFERAVFPLIAGLDGDTGARKLLAALPGVSVIRSEDKGCLFDVDREEDLTLG